MKSIIVLFFWFWGLFYSCKIHGQNNQIDSIKIVSLDAGWTYIPYGGYDIDFIKSFLDDKLSWERFDPNSKIEYKCVLTERKLINRFKQLLSKCNPGSDTKLSRFLQIPARIGLKIYKGSQIEYIFIQTNAPPEYKYDKYIITKKTELRASNALIRFLKKMKRERRCKRCQ